MAKITINDLLSTKSNSLLHELSHIESMTVFGGEDSNFDQLLQYGVKTLEFFIIAYAINTIASLTSSFTTVE